MPLAVIRSNYPACQKQLIDIDFDLIGTCDTTHKKEKNIIISQQLNKLVTEFAH